MAGACRIAALLAAAGLWPAARVRGQAATTTPSAQLFGPKYVLTKYTDSSCRNVASGQGATQSWTRVIGATSCYEITTGLLCTYRCTVKMGCQYGTGSGVLVYIMDDDSCQTTRSNTPLAQQWYWLQAQSFFTGGCVSAPSGSGYLKFSPPLDKGQWPNCSSTGGVAPGVAGSAENYETTYALQFYSDLSCNQVYNVSTYGVRPTSRFLFKLYRGAQYCYDMLDDTPRGNVTSRQLDFDMLNWQFQCGNLDGMGNGYMVRGFTGPKCTDPTTGTESWQDAFYPINYPDTMSLFAGKCTRWGQFRVQFDRPLDPSHYPDCAAWSCKAGEPCSGGRIKSSTDQTGQAYSGEIRTSGGDPANPQGLASKAAPGPAALQLARSALPGLLLSALAAGRRR